MIVGILSLNYYLIPNPPVMNPSLPDVKITNFICTGVWGNSRLGSDLDLFSLNYTNLGAVDVKNLTITVNTSRADESDISLS